MKEKILRPIIVDSNAELLTGKLGVTEERFNKIQEIVDNLVVNKSHQEFFNTIEDIGEKFCRNPNEMTIALMRLGAIRSMNAVIGGLIEIGNPFVPIVMDIFDGTGVPWRGESKQENS